MPSQSDQSILPSQPVVCFLPDFCTPQTLFLLIISVELLALVLALVQGQGFGEFWVYLNNISFVCQSIALISAMLLCQLRPLLAPLSAPFIALTVLVLTQSVIVIVTLLALWATQYMMEWTNISEYLLPLVRNLAIGSIVTLIALRYAYIQHQWQQSIEARTRARIQALQARIHPHFLFNTLNTIASLIQTQPEQAEQAVLDLSDLMRSALAYQERIPLGDELELTRRYLAIEHLRLGERLRVDWQLGDDLPLDALFPGLLLQPLVENAVRHGIQTLPEGGCLSIQIDARPGALQFTIANPRHIKNDELPRPGQGLAQSNIRQRLALTFGQTCHLETTESADHYQVTFTVPLLDDLVME